MDSHFDLYVLCGRCAILHVDFYAVIARRFEPMNRVITIGQAGHYAALNCYVDLQLKGCFPTTLVEMTFANFKLLDLNITTVVEI